jgi:hypothetical protein
MSDETRPAEHVRVIAEQAGIARALELFPEAVNAAADRGLRPLADPPTGHSPTAHPAPVFDPASFERER